MMNCIMTSILAYLWIATVISNAGAECISSNNDAVKLLIRNHRNRTGHLISQVVFEHRGGFKETDVWRVDVEETTEICEGVEDTSYLTFTISGPLPQPTVTTRPTVTTKPTVTTRPTVIARPTGYELFPGIGYYKFHDDVATWPRAREICAEEGAHLIIVNSEKESDVTRTLFARYPLIKGASGNDWAWVGVRDPEGVNGQYQTIFGVPLNDTGFSRWFPGEPNLRGTTGDYISVNRVNGGLADAAARPGYRYAFICEQEL